MVFWCEYAQVATVAFYVDYVGHRHRFAVNVGFPLFRAVNHHGRGTEAMDHCVFVDESGEYIHPHHGSVYR